MKKVTFTLLALFALCFVMQAQEYVSTEPANRNVLIEEYTGRSCPYCPQGHLVANQLMENNPGRVFAVNYHSTSMGSLSPTGFPNLNLPVSTTYMNPFGPDGIPMGVINRCTATAQNRGAWTGLTNQQLAQAAECNVAGYAIVNPDARIATITVEVYYTANSNVNENYLTIQMLQDSIIGSQSGSSYNPAQIIGNSYCHMHTLRSVITEPWGDAISPTTAGTLITKTYEYHIPQSIGSPNPVDVDINNIFFIAFVAEQYQGTPTRPILNVCEIEPVLGSSEPIYPVVSSMNVQEGNSCTQNKVVEVNLSNIGTETLTSMSLVATMEGETQTISWEGSLPQFGDAVVEIPLLVPFGTHTFDLAITEANGVATQTQSSCQIECLEWTNLDVTGESEQLKLMLVQDKYGAQTTWEFLDSNGEVIASGGPYATLAGSSSTLPHAEIVTVPANECVTFVIHDSGENGICCDFGNGFYKIFDSNNVLIIDGSGDFGSKASHLISVNNASTVSVATQEPRVIGDNSAIFSGDLTGYAQEVGFEYRKLTDPTLHTAVAMMGDGLFTATVDDLELNTMYSVKAYALVGNTKVYGEEVHFHTWVEGVSELEKTLKIYPNPANQRLNVNGNMTYIEVYNIMGQCLLSKPVEGNTQIELAEFSNGVYFLRVSNNGETVVRKFTVNH